MTNEPDSTREPESALQTRPILLIRIRDAQDLEAWRTFVVVYAPLVHAYCRKQGLQDADAADVCQEVLSQVSRSIRGFEYQPERGRFRDWLGQVTRSKLGRFRNKEQRGLASGLGGEGPQPIDDAATTETDPEWTAECNRQIMRTALERIRPQFEAHTWRAFELAWLEDRPASDAADELSLSIEVVYKAKSRVLKRLREEVLMLAEDVPQLFT
jgi:RNA polymerase sigma-70 factor (ECF subfamily)